MRDLNGKVAVITGAGSGIGRGMALAFAQAGMTVVVADIEVDAARRVAAEIGGLPVTTDVTRLDDVRALADIAFREFGTVHLLCNNAGVVVGAPIDHLTPEDWRFVLSVNLEGVVNGLVSFLPRLRDQQDEAHIVNTASIGGHLPVPGLGAYCASKFAVVGISEVLRLEAASYGVGVSVLCPSFVRTNLGETSARNRPPELAATGAVQRPDPARAEQVLAGALDPEDVGRTVRKAVEDNELYIFTHRDKASRSMVEARMEAIRAAF